MVVLTTDQELFVEKQFLVHTGGTFADEELVPVYRIDDPDKVGICSYPAAYIATGEFAPTTVEGTQDWDGLLNTLRGTLIFQKCFTTASVNGWSLLLVTLTQTHNLFDLYFAFQQVKLGIPEPYALSVEEVAEINIMLQAHHIPMIVE